jgi:hypothetical protein
MFRNNNRKNLGSINVCRCALFAGAISTTSLTVLSLPAGALEPSRQTAKVNKMLTGRSHPVTDAELRQRLAEVQKLLARRACQGRGGDAPAQEANVGMDAYTQMVKNLADLVDDLIQDRPNGTENKREAAFKTLSVIYFAMLFGGITLPPAGALIGTGVGAIAGAPVADLGGVTIGAGTALGFGAGMVASVGEVTLATIIIVSLSLEMNDRYPPESAGLSSGLAMRGFCGYRNAGPWESMLVNTIGMAFSERLYPLADDWDMMGRLSSSQRSFLRSIKSLQPALKRAADIKRTRRIAPNAPMAAPMSSWMQDVEKIIWPGSEGAEEAWLHALGVGEVSAKVKDGKLTVTMPPALQAAGAPETVKADLSNLRVKVGGNGGATDPYLKASVEPGDFNIHFGDAALLKSGSDKDKIRVSFSIHDGSTLGRAKVSYRWNGPEETLSAFSPKLTENATANAFFKVTDQGLTFDHVDIGSIQIGLNLPSGLPSGIPGLSDLIESIKDGMKSAIKGMVKDSLKLGPALQALESYPAASMKKALDSDAAKYGFSRIDSVVKLMATNGQLRARVKGTVFDLPGGAQYGQQVVAAYNKSYGLGRTLLRPRTEIGSRVRAGRINQEL